MSTSSNNSDLEKLARKLTSQGPHKQEHTPRRVRGLLNGKYVFDTTDAIHVWEHPYYPQFYIPHGSFTKDANLCEDSSAIPNTNDGAYFAELSIGDRSTDRVVCFKCTMLQDLVKIDFPALDAWFEEDVRIYQHPKDPYKRIDILSSSRSIKISLHGTTLAETMKSFILHETSLRPRYYLPPTDVKWEYLRKSQTETYCPYKGKANYYDVEIHGKTYKDLVWWYQYPTKESVEITGTLCFYNEKVDVFVDGVLENK